MVPFNIPPYVGKELDYVAQAVLVNHKLCGDGPFTKQCQKWLEEHTGCYRALLTFSVPYDRGWHVYVNGEERELLQVNVMYCGVLLEPGEYEIELRYDQPGSGPGTLISAAAVLAIVPVCVFGRLRRKKREN